MNTAIWSQTYDPFGNAVVSTLVAAIPIVVLLGLIAAGKVQAYLAAIAALVAAFLVATLAFGMPVAMATKASIFGIAHRPVSDRLDHPQRPSSSTG